MKWILLAFAFVESADHTPSPAIATAEFSSLEACDAAGTKWNITVEQESHYRFHFLCVPDFANPQAK
jgi:hypothetical protein